MKEIKVKNHITICNIGSIGRTEKLISELREDKATKDDYIVLIDDSLEELPAELRDEKILFVKGNPAREPVLLQANIEESKAVLIQARVDDLEHSDEYNLKIGLTIECLSPQTFTVVECINPENEIFFRRARCDSVVCIASLTGQMIAQELQDPGVGAIISELTSNVHGKQFYVVKPPGEAKTYRDIEAFYEDKEVILLGLRRGEKNFLMPKHEFSVQEGDKVIMIAKKRPH